MPVGQSIPVPSNAPPWVGPMLRVIEVYIGERDKSPVPLPSFTVAELLLLDAAKYFNCAVICSDETGGRTIAVSDGTDFCRVSNGAPVS